MRMFSVCVANLIGEVKYSVAVIYITSGFSFFRNILVDKPNDQSSRWSSESNYPPQVSIWISATI